MGNKTTSMVGQVQTPRLLKQDKVEEALFEKEARRILYSNEDMSEASDAIEEEANDEEEFEDLEPNSSLAEFANKVILQESFATKQSKDDANTLNMGL